MNFSRFFSKIQIIWTQTNQLDSIRLDNETGLNRCKKSAWAVISCNVTVFNLQLTDVIILQGHQSDFSQGKRDLKRI